MKNNELAKQLDEDIFFALFRKGAHEYLEGEVPDEHAVPGGALSDDREKKIMRLVRRELLREKSAKLAGKALKTAAIILIVLSVCAAAVMSVEAFRVPVLNLFITPSAESTDISVGKDMPDAAERAFSPDSLYVPAGFELTATEEYAEIVRYIYSDAGGRTVLINRYVLGSFFGIDTEDAETGEIDINGYAALYSIKKGITFLTFKTDEYAYKIEASLELPEVIKIAQSIR